MKLLVFAHTPPPLHGQSFMVQVLLEGLKRRGSGSSTEVYHVNCRVSDDLEDVGGIRLGKLFRLAGYCWRALWLRFRHGADTLYYVPAPAKRSAVVRDWIVMLFVRPWFRRTIFHWHAFGLGHWAACHVENPGGDEGPVLFPPVLFGAADRGARSLTSMLLGRADLSIVLTSYNACDARFFSPKQIQIVANGIIDPCPQFPETVLPERLRRLAVRHGDAEISGKKCSLQVLFLAHCTKEKGIFDALDAVACANRSAVRITLTLAGKFLDRAEQADFERRMAAVNVQLGFEAVQIAGFLNEDAKRLALASHDVLCFPTRYSGEGMPVSVIEALAFGMPVVATAWRGLPDILPSCLPAPCAPGDIPALAAALIACSSFGAFEALRSDFLEKYGVDAHLEAIRNAIAGQ